MLEGQGNELLTEHGVLLHGELQMNGALSAGISVENTPQAWDAATSVDPLCHPLGFRTACEVTNV